LITVESQAIQQRMEVVSLDCFPFTYQDNVHHRLHPKDRMRYAHNKMEGDILRLYEIHVFHVAALSNSFCGDYD